MGSSAVRTENLTKRYGRLTALDGLRLEVGAGEVCGFLGAGIAAWTGTAVVDAGLPVGAALAGAWNVLPVAVLSCGAAVLAAGVAPRAVLAVCPRSPTSPRSPTGRSTCPPPQS